MNTPEHIPNRLIFSANNSRRKKRAYIVVILLTFVQLSMLWPIFPLFASATPLILGFPLSFAWVILMVICSFSFLLWFFLNEEKTSA
jgi:hypothetical protein